MKSFLRSALRAAVAAGLCSLLASPGMQPAAAPAASSQAAKAQKTQVSPISGLPLSIAQAVKKAKVNPQNFSVSVVPLTGGGPSLSYNAAVPRTPASIEKVVTSALALDILGPAKVWATKAVSDAAIENGVLKGDLYLVGDGDPVFTAERFWLLIDNLRARGIKKIEGDLIVDRNAFSVTSHNPFAFDGEGNRPYNLGPDALLVNYRSQVIQIRPDKKKGVAYLYPSPRIDGITYPESIPLSQDGCGQWRKQIKPDFSNPSAPKFLGKYPLACGAKDYFYTSFDADPYIEKIFKSFWKQAGGEWSGKVKAGKRPDAAEMLAVNYSVPLSQILHNLNKYSNNQVARQLFLSVGKTAPGEGKNLAASRQRVQDLKAKLKIPENELYMENGSGLSRASKLSASASSKILEFMWQSPYMSEFMSSLPISGVDGTMKKRTVAKSFAHIKTGYVANTRSISGYVKGKSGKYYAVTAIINGPEALGGIPVLDAVIDWVFKAG